MTTAAGNRSADTVIYVTVKLNMEIITYRNSKTEHGDYNLP